MKTEPTFKVSRADGALILEIVVRARELWPRLDGLALSMDLHACHANGCPLDLERLLSSDRGTFAHDVGGIAHHIDRQTGKLRDCFLPRTARPQANKEHTR